MNPWISLALRSGAGLAALKYVMQPRVYRAIMQNVVVISTLGGFAFYTGLFSRHTLKSTEMLAIDRPLNGKEFSLKDIFSKEQYELVFYFQKFWITHFIPTLKAILQSDKMDSYKARKNIEEKITFCSFGEKMGSSCIHLLGETACKKVLCFELSEEEKEFADNVYEKASTLFSEKLKQKVALFFSTKYDINMCVLEGVNVVFMNCDTLSVSKRNSIITMVSRTPTVQFLITTEKLNEDFHFTLVKSAHLSADWSNKTQYFIYRKI